MSGDGLVSEEEFKSMMEDPPETWALGIENVINSVGL